MEAIATLVQHDPYFDAPISERIAARRERRARIWDARELPPLIKSPPIIDPVPAKYMPKAPKRSDPQDYRCMWFYNLVFETEAKLPQILAMRNFESRPLRLEEIQMAVARFYGVARADLLSARRTAAIVRPRQVGYYLSKMLTSKSLPEIGRRYGSRDHTSILSGYRKIERLRKTDPKLNSEVIAIATALGGSL